MKTYLQIIFMCLVLTLSSIGRINSPKTHQSTGFISPSKITFQEAEQPWIDQYIHRVDYPDDVGAFASLAFRPYDDIPYISYYDALNGDLMLAHYLPQGGGNCGTDNYWLCEILDGADGSDTGQYTSIDFWADEANNAWKIGISYHDVTHNSLKFTSWWCSEQYCTRPSTNMINSSWIPNTVVGAYTSFKFGADGIPHIAYSYIDRNFFGLDSLKYASYVSSGGNCGAGSASLKWQCDKIDIAILQVGLYASLDLTYDGTPYIAYYDEFDGDLKLAYYLGITVEDCNEDNGWECPVIDGTDGSDVGLYASLTAQHSPGDKLFRIAYYDKTNSQLKYYDPDWGAVVVDDMGSNISPMDISMDIDQEGYPVIAYQQAKPGEYETPDLRLARPFQAYPNLNIGNCGSIPPGWDNLYWYCNTLDYGGVFYDEAEYISVAVNSSGLVGIAYSEFYDYDAGDHATSLKYISQKFLSFLPMLFKP